MWITDMEDLAKAYQPQRRPRSKHLSFSIQKWVIFAVFLIYAVSLLFPFLWMLLNSFKSGEEFMAGNLFGWPKQFYGLNFAEVMTYEVEGQTVWSMLVNSIILTVAGTIINVFLSACAAYCLSKYRFVGRRFIYAMAIFTMIVPIVGTLPSEVVMMETFHMEDSLLGVLFLYSGCFGFNFLLLYSSFNSISWSYAEAAAIDGAGRFKTFFTIMLPMAKGPLIACAILQAIVYWNDYTTPFLFMPSQMTLAVGLQRLQEELGGSSGNYPMVFASMLIALLPVLLLYIIFQKKIIENTNAGGLKG
jgi:ABC-type glycerol-3-phosphate transport system permease component